MAIYPSDKVRPYVYMGVDLVTGKFYIGSREKNVKLNKPSHIDIFEYKTSSKKVRPIFSNFTWIIVAEFETGDAAYDFEQHLIYENWHNPLLLNGSCFYGKARFKVTSLTDRSKLKSMLGKKGPLNPNFGKSLTVAHKDNISKGSKNKKKPLGFGVGAKNSNYGKRRPGLNAGEANCMFGKTGEQHHNFGKHMTVKSRLRENEALYTQIALLLNSHMPVKEIALVTDTKESLIYRIKNKKHAIWAYMREHNANQL